MFISELERLAEEKEQIIMLLKEEKEHKIRNIQELETTKANLQKQLRVLESGNLEEIETKQELNDYIETTSIEEIKSKVEKIDFIITELKNKKTENEEEVINLVNILVKDFERVEKTEFEIVTMKLKESICIMLEFALKRNNAAIKGEEIINLSSSINGERLTTVPVMNEVLINLDDIKSITSSLGEIQYLINEYPKAPTELGKVVELLEKYKR